MAGDPRQHPRGDADVIATMTMPRLIDAVERRSQAAFAGSLVLHGLIWTALPALLYANLPWRRFTPRRHVASSTLNRLPDSVAQSCSIGSPRTATAKSQCSDAMLADRSNACGS